MDSFITAPSTGTKVVSSVSDETVFLNDGHALITNLKCAFAGATRIYATSGITSVGMDGTQQRIVGSAFLAGIGLGYLYYREPNPQSLAFAAICLLIAYVLYWVGRPWYTLSLHTAGGRYTPIKSRDQQYVAGLLMALNEAIMRRG